MSVLAAALLVVASVQPAWSAGWYLSGPDGSPGVLVVGEGAGPSGPGVVVRVDPGEHLEFVADHDGLHLDGRPGVEVWTTSTEPGTAGEIRVSLLACEGGACRSLASTRLLEEPWAWAPEGSLEAKVVELPAVNEVLTAGERICLRIEVLGDDAVVFGYGSPEHPSSVLLPIVGATRPAPAGGGDEINPSEVLPPPQSDPSGIAEVVPDDRSDLVSRPGLGFTPGIAESEPGWAPSVVVGLVVTCAVVASGALASWGRRAIADGDLRTRRLPGRPARR